MSRIISTNYYTTLFYRYFLRPLSCYRICFCYLLMKIRNFHKVHKTFLVSCVSIVEIPQEICSWFLIKTLNLHKNISRLWRLIMIIIMKVEFREKKILRKIVEILKWKSFPEATQLGQWANLLNFLVDSTIWNFILLQRTMIPSQVPQPPWLPARVNRVIPQVRFPPAAQLEVAHWTCFCQRLIAAVKCTSHVNWLNYIRNLRCRCLAVSGSPLCLLILSISILWKLYVIF